MNNSTVITRTVKAMEYLRAITNRPRMEIQQVSLLLKLYELEPEGVTMRDLVKESACSQSMVSRNVSAFGVKSKQGAQRLVALRIGEDTRYRMVHFLPAGREIMATVVGIINGSVVAPDFSPAVDTRTKT